MSRILMIDCETLSLDLSAVILQVAVQIVELDPYKVLFSMAFWPNLSEQADRKIDADTVIWWMQRSQEAQRRVLEGHVSSLQPSTTRVELFKAFAQVGAMVIQPLPNNLVGALVQRDSRRVGRRGICLLSGLLLRRFRFRCFFLCHGQRWRHGANVPHPLN